MKTASFRLLIVTVMLCLASAAFAKPRKWQEAKVLKLTHTEAGAQVVVVPVGSALYGVETRNERGFYWIKAKHVTYVIRNYSNGFFIQHWLILTIGAKVKISPDGKNLRVIDDQGKDRSVRIVEKLANKPPAKAKMPAEARQPKK